MKTITITSDSLPVLAGCDFCMANEPFFHVDRIPDFYVLIFVVSGCIYVTEEDTDYEIHPGQLLILQSGIRHYGKYTVPKGTSWYYAHFYMKVSFRDYLSLNTPPAFNEPLCFQMDLPKYHTGLEQSKIAAMIAELANSLHSGNAMAHLTNTVSNYQAEDSMVFWNANLHLFSILTELAAANLPPAPKNTLSDRIADYLSHHTSESFSAEALEKYFFLSYKHMAAVFKKEKHLTLLQYHTKSRIAEACRLLRSTMKSVGEIAEELGYHDMLYFSRCFRQTMGVSPTEYRKQQIVNY